LLRRWVKTPGGTAETQLHDLADGSEQMAGQGFWRGIAALTVLGGGTLGYYAYSGQPAPYPLTEVPYFKDAVAKSQALWALRRSRLPRHSPLARLERADLAQADRPAAADLRCR
jgi:hypothetical protein